MEIYADNAATTALSPLALEAMLPFFDQTYANPSSLHDPGQRAAEALAQARESIAQCLRSLLLKKSISLQAEAKRTLKHF